MSASGPWRTSLVAPHMSAFGGKADIAAFGRDVACARFGDGDALRHEVIHPSYPKIRRLRCRHCMAQSNSFGTTAIDGTYFRSKTFTKILGPITDWRRLSTSDRA